MQNLVGPDRLRNLFERINPDQRRERLESELKELQGRFIKTYTDLLSQERYAVVHRTIYEDASADDPALNNKKVLAEGAEEQARQLQILADHLAGEVERIEQAVEDMKKAGSEALHDNRQARRSRSRQNGASTEQN